VLKCALHPKLAEKFTKTPFEEFKVVQGLAFGPSGWAGSYTCPALRPYQFKVIDVNKSKKAVTSACYDKQHVCTYLQPFSHYTS